MTYREVYRLTITDDLTEQDAHNIAEYCESIKGWLVLVEPKRTTT